MAAQIQKTMNSRLRGHRSISITPMVQEYEFRFCHTRMSVRDHPHTGHHSMQKHHSDYSDNYYRLIPTKLGERSHEWHSVVVADHHGMYGFASVLLGDSGMMPHSYHPSCVSLSLLFSLAHLL